MTKMRKKQRTFKAIILVIILIIVANTLFHSLKRGVTTITIQKGESSTKIAEILKDKGLITSKTYFLARLYLSSYRGKLKYGTFKLDNNATAGEIIKKLSTEGAKKNTVTVTIPEGYSIEKIRDTLCEAGLVTESEFEDAVKQKYDYAFLDCVPNSDDLNYKLQGFLYPSTYEFYSDAKATTIIDKMLSEFQKKITPLNIPNNELFSIITKASMVEREAKIPSERPVIAGVFENRLSQNMRMQVDATVMYVITEGKYDTNKVYYKDLNNKSKYNTYKYEGLPVGPICSPSIDSIKAAQNPAVHKYLYYHTDTNKNDGTHIFTENFEEHKKTQ